MIMISGCLAGINCRYDGHNSLSVRIVDLIKKGIVLLPVCPEQLGGCATPRPPAEIQCRRFYPGSMDQIASKKQNVFIQECNNESNQVGNPGYVRKMDLADNGGAAVLDGECRVHRKTGEDATVEFIRGANEVLKIARLMDIKIAILKAKSPSCGTGHIYDGTFTQTLVHGNGVTAELLQRNGIKVFDENDFPSDSANI